MKYIRILIISLIIFLGSTISVEAAEFMELNFAKGLGSTNREIGRDITIDSNNNIFVTGRFQLTVDFDEDNPPFITTDTETSNGGDDTFIAKYDNNGNNLWVKNIGNSSHGSGLGATVDSNNNLIFTGYESNAGVDFDEDSVISGDTVNFSTTQDGWIAKYNNNGVLSWVKPLINGSNAVVPFGVDTDNSNNIYVAGRFGGTVDFDQENVIAGDTVTGTASNDGFIAKYSPSGVILWVNEIVSSGDDTAYQVVFDGNSSIYVTGYYSGTVDFEPNSVVSGDTETSNGAQDLFLAKYSASNGQLQWVKSAGFTGNDYAYGVDVDSSGNVYTTGYFHGTVDFDEENVIFSDSHLSAGLGDSFFAKYDPNGVILWAKGIGSTGEDYGYTVNIDDNDNAYFIGAFTGTVDFDEGNALFNDTRTGNGGVDGYIAVLSSTGELLTVKSFGGTAADVGRAAVLNGDNIFITGPFRNTVDFEPDDFVILDTHTSEGDEEIYIAKYRKYTATRILSLNSGLDVIDNETQLDAEQYNESFASGTSNLRLSNTSGVVIADIDTNLTDDRNWSSVNAGSDTVNGKAFAHNLSTAEGTASTYTLYIPKLPATNGVTICPNATNLGEVTSECAGGYVLALSDPSLTEINISGQDYFVVPGLSGTGGIGETGVKNAIGDTMRVVLRDSDLTGVSSDVEIWWDTFSDIAENTIIRISYEEEFTGGSSITTADVTVTCEADGVDPLSGTEMTSVTVTESLEGFLELNTNTDTCTEWMVVDINGDGGNSLTNPADPGNYGWGVTVDVLGDGNSDDDGATLAYVQDENDLTITANVPPILDMEIYEANVDNLLNGTGANTCELGVLSINTISTCSYDLATGTNNFAGVSIYIQSDGELRDGSGNEIDACNGTNCDSLGGAGVDAGEEEYGIYISELGGGEYSAGGSFGTQHQSIPTIETLFASSSTTGSGTTTGSVAQRLEITHAASISTATTQGSYSHIVTYTVFTN